MTHDEAEALLGAYALDAVDPQEAEAIELHVRDCPRCSAEVAAHRETAALLAHTGVDAPAGVWDAIAASLDGPRVPSLARASMLRRRVSWSRTLAAAAAVVVLAAGVAWVVGRQARPTTDVASRRDPLDTAIIAAYADPHATSAHLRSGDGRRRVDVVLLPSGTGFVVSHNLPILADGRTYQLWGKVGTSTVSLGLLGRAPGKTAFAISGKLTALAITDEVAPGVSAPTHEPVVAVAV